MPRSSYSFCLAVATLVIGALLMGQTAPPPAAAPAGPPPTKLAVVNILQLFNSLDERATGEAELKNMSNTYNDQITAKRKDLEDLDNQLKSPQLFKAGSVEYRKAQDDLLQKTFDLQSYQQLSQQKLFIEQRLKTADLYNKMNDAIAAYAQANGIALVFCADDMNLAAARSQQELFTMITVRKLVYYHPSFDITRQLIEKMNTDYKFGARKTP